LLDGYNEQWLVGPQNDGRFSGKLKCSNGESILIDLEDGYYSGGHLDSIAWRCKNGGTITTLNNDISHGHIYPQYVIEGSDLPDKYSGFLLRLNDVSEWLHRWSHFEEENNSLTKEIPKQVFSVPIKKPDGAEATISSAFQYSINKPKSRQDVTEIEEFYYVEVSYQKPKTIEYMVDDAMHIRRLFSYLLGSPLNIEGLVLTESNQRFPIAFTNAKTTGTITSPLDAVIDASYLNENNLWERVFQSFYDQTSYKRFKGLWSRFFGAMAHDGYWEHGIFGCVSLLEAYCSIYCGNIDESLPEKIFDDLVESYKSLIDEHKNKSDDLSPVIFDGLKGLLGSSRNTKYPTFDMKFDKLIEDTPCEIVESIGITKEDFKHIKDIRNKVAHGGTPKTLDHQNLTHEETIKNKLMVLIMYYLYKDLGFNKNDFINFISKRFNTILRSACLNTERIDYFSDKVPFYEVGNVSFNSVKETNGHELVFKYDPERESLVFDEATTQTLKNRKPNSSTEYTYTEHFVYDSVSEKSGCNAIGYFNHFYVSHGEENKEMRGAFVINPSEEMCRLCRVYPHKS